MTDAPDTENADVPSPALMDLPEATAPAARVETATAYQVLALKYRPRAFGQLIGQDVLARTLSNAIRAGRVHHAYLFTGVRGVGKTTTARIVARALNCVGRDGQGGPTPSPCGVCEPCRAILDDRHVDVMEMDAASRTGVDDIREILDGVRYRPVSARHKIYIIDEVHMLSRHAFNALLKTLEEPPESVVFMFATTEARKVPLTVLSRCMRFDLRRVEPAVIRDHLADIAGREGRQVAGPALDLLARAADGSVRDGLSLLDQAFAHAGADDALDEALVRDMLGLADRGQTLDLYEAVIRGATARALDLLGEMYNSGVDPLALIQDLLEITHWLTRIVAAPSARHDDLAMTAALHQRGAQLAEGLTISALSRVWQMLLKGLAEVGAAPRPLPAAEMVLIRIAHVRDMPTPGDLAALVSQGLQHAAGAAARSPASPAAAGPAADPPAPASSAGAGSGPEDFRDLVELVIKHRQIDLHRELRNHVRLVRLEPGRLEFRPGPEAPCDLAPRLSRALGEITGRQWFVAVSNEPGAPTLREQDDAEQTRRFDAARAHPLVAAALETFPDARIVAVRERRGAETGDAHANEDIAERTNSE